MTQGAPPSAATAAEGHRGMGSWLFGGRGKAAAASNTTRQPSGGGSGVERSQRADGTMADTHQGQRTASSAAGLRGHLAEAQHRDQAPPSKADAGSVSVSLPWLSFLLHLSLRVSFPPLIYSNALTDVSGPSTKAY